MRNLLISIFLLYIFSGCYNENRFTVKPPERLLPEDTFVMVLTDVELVEGAIEYSREHHLKNRNKTERFYSYIYKKYNLTPVLLKQNMDYYNSNPDNMIKIYDKVLANLTQVQTVLDLKKKTREIRIKDSLAKIDTTHYVYKNIKKLPEKKQDTLVVKFPIW